MYCLDSDIVIDYIKGDSITKGKIDRLGTRVFITSITLCELFKGAYLSLNAEKNLSLIGSLSNYFYFLELENNAARVYGIKYSELKKTGQLTQDFDLMIASICIANNKILVTHNKKHFENIKGLKIAEWQSL